MDLDGLDDDWNLSVMFEKSDGRVVVSMKEGSEGRTMIPTF